MNQPHRIIMTLIFATLCQNLPRARAAETGQLLSSLGVQIRNGKQSPLVNGVVQARGYLAPWVILELSAIFGKVEYSSPRNSNFELLESGTRIRTPLLFRFPFFNHFSAGAGFYGSYRIGDVKSSAVVSSEFQTSAHDTGEHGLEAALGASIPLSENKSWIQIDLRSTYSLTPRQDEGFWWQQVVLGFQQTF